MSSSREFKTSSYLSTKRASVSSVTLGQAGTSDPSEARYWMQTFGLGNSNLYGSSNNTHSHPRSLRLSPLGPSIVVQVLFGPPAFQGKQPLAVVAGPRVSLYGSAGPSLARALQQANPSESTLALTPDRNLSTGGHPAQCAAFRSDGRLVAVGTSQGQVRVCDVTSRATLVTFKSSLCIRTVAWCRNGKQVVSGGDEAMVQLWSLSAPTSTTLSSSDGPLLSLKGHGDSVRCLVLWQPRNSSACEWKELVMSGSYDHTIRIWNVQDPSEQQEDRCLGVLNHGAPVEALLLLAHSNPKEHPPWLISAGGTTLKVWNPLTGVCVCTLSTQHSKTITSLIATTRPVGSEKQWRILTAGLDGLVRIHTFASATGQVQHVHGVKVSHEPLTSMAVNEGMDRLALGTTSGHTLLRAKGPSVTQQKRSREPRAGTYAYFMRGMNASSEGSDYVMASTDKKRKLTAYDTALKQFRYGDALDEALGTRQPQAVVAVLEELGKRRGLTIALSNRDEETLEPILSFSVRYITRPQFASLLIGVAHKLCDIYGNVAGQSETIDELFDKLRSQVYNECRAQKSLLRIVGQLDAILTAAEMEDGI